MKPLSRPAKALAAPALFQLLSDSALSRAALNNCGVPLALLGAGDANHLVCYVNAAFAAYFGFAESEVIGHPLAKLVLRGDQALMQKMVSQSPARWELTVWHKSGTAQHVELSLGVVRDSDGRHTHWVLTFSDRSELERLRAELESMKTVGVGSLALRVEASHQPARGAQQARVEAAAPDELHAERQTAGSLHQR